MSVKSTRVSLKFSINGRIDSWVNLKSVCTTAMPARTYPLLCPHGEEYYFSNQKIGYCLSDFELEMLKIVSDVLTLNLWNIPYRFNRSYPRYLIGWLVPDSLRANTSNDQSSKVWNIINETWKINKHNENSVDGTKEVFRIQKAHFET